MKKINLSQQTIMILKNFSTINPSIYFVEGNVIKTRSMATDVYAMATIQEEIPKEFAVYDLNRFLSVCGLFAESPELNFNVIDNGVMIGSASNAVRYIYSDPIIIPEAVVSPEEYVKNPKMPPIAAQFTLKTEQLNRVIKAASVLGSPNVSIISDGTTLQITTHDKRQKLCDQYNLIIENPTSLNGAFNIDLKLETLRLIPGDYEVSVGERIAVRFNNEAAGVQYFITGNYN